jgi:hypothetical protein
MASNNDASVLNFFFIEYKLEYSFNKLERGKAMKARKILCFAIILTLLLTALTACTNINKTIADVTPHMGIPNMMQPNTIVIYDNNENPIYVQGGPLTDEEKSKIEPYLLYDTSDQGIYAKPGIKVEYYKHGEIENIYYPVPNSPGTYQLADPNPSEFPKYAPSPILIPVIMKPNTIIVYDRDTNYIIVQGGNPSASDISAATAHINNSNLANLITKTMYAKPGLKITYDQYGVINNT